MPITKEALEIYVVRFTDSELADAFKNRDTLAFKAENGVEITVLLKNRIESNIPGTPIEYCATLKRTNGPYVTSEDSITFRNVLRFLPHQDSVDILDINPDPPA